MTQILGTSVFHTALVYVALLILGEVVLAVGVSRQRQRAKVAFGDGGDQLLQQWIRAHANYCENVPFGIAALILMPLAGETVVAIHIVGLCLVVGRIAHAYGLTTSPGPSPGRAIGAGLTALGLILGALSLIWHAFA